MNLVDQPAHDREMAAHDAVKCVPEIARNHCPNSAKYAIYSQSITDTLRSVAFPDVVENTHGSFR